MKRIVIVIAAFVILFIPNIAQSPANATYTEHTGDSKTVYTLTNEYRKSLGLNSLYAHKELVKSAQNKANHLCEMNYFAHDLPNGEKWVKFIDDVDINYLTAGENLAKNYYGDSIVSAWIESPKHDENLKAEWEYIGIAQSKCGAKTYTVAHYASVAK